MRASLSIKKNLLQLFAAFVVPLDKGALWKTDQFSKLPKNEVKFEKKQLQIHVKNSASLLVYLFDDTLNISGFRVTGSFSDLPHFDDVTKQGTSGYDDYPLRIGLVVPGGKKLTAFKKLFLPDWVIHLYNLLPKGQGLDHVHFFNLTQNKNQVGTVRIHPSSNFITEEFFDLIEQSGDFSKTHTFKEKINSVGLWISVDGDDTKSEYTLNISKLEFETN